LPSSKRRTRPLVLGNKGARTPPNVSGHRNLGAVYRRKVEELETSLKDADHRDEAMEFIRMLVDKVELTPREGSGLSSTADLVRILVCALDTKKAPAALAGGLMGGSRRNAALEGGPRGLVWWWLRGQDLNL
jgi:hypothetical protein